MPEARIPVWLCSSGSLGSDFQPRHHARGCREERARFSVKEKDETSRQEGILPNSLKPSFPDLSESGGFLF